MLTGTGTYRDLEANFERNTVCNPVRVFRIHCCIDCYITGWSDEYALRIVCKMVDYFAEKCFFFNDMCDGVERTISNM